jgi:hypothetical protein
MRTLNLILVAAFLSICSCSDKGQRLPMGDDPSWVSEEAARKLCEDFLRKRGYTNAQIEGETAMREKCWYVFATNGTTAPLKVMVDRKSREVGYGDWKR